MAAFTKQSAVVFIPFVAAYIFAVRAYVHELEPVTTRFRYQFGHLDAVLAEIISGIEVVKASARELFERAKYRAAARQLHDTAVQQGRIEALGRRGIDEKNAHQTKPPGSIVAVPPTTGPTGT